MNDSFMGCQWQTSSSLRVAKHTPQMCQEASLMQHSFMRYFKGEVKNFTGLQSSLSVISVALGGTHLSSKAQRKKFFSCNKLRRVNVSTAPYNCALPGVKDLSYLSGMDKLSSASLEGMTI